MGVAPGQPPPSGNFIYPYTGGSDPLSVRHTQTDWTTATLTSVMKTPAVASFSNAQAVHQSNVISPINSNTTQLGQTGTTATNHENRITKLENGDQIAVFYTSDTWHKPSGFAYHKVAEMGGGGGGQGGQWLGSQYGGQGGGQGGWSKQVFTDAALTLSSYAVTVGPGGLGAYTSYTENFARANSPSLGANWRTDSGAVSAAIVNQAVESFPQPGFTGENGMWHTWVGGDLIADNYYVDALIAAPSTAVASNNFTGISVANPTTFSGASKLVAFIGSTGSGCKIITQVNQVSSPYIASGSQTGQATVATTSTNITSGCVMRLVRQGNVFSAYIYNPTTLAGLLTPVMTWTDSSNTVLAGVGNRRFGFIVEGNHPAFQNEFHSPAIADLLAVDIDGTSGSASSFIGGATSLVAGGGAFGATYNAGSSASAARGSGTETSLNAGGGTGGNGTTYTTTATAGGNGLGVTGGAVVTSAGQRGFDGQNGMPASYGPAGGGSGGGGSATFSGAGGNAGFPGAGGGGGGGGPKPGPGGVGSNGMVWVVSSNSSVF